jgi:hypothetical protein
MRWPGILAPGWGNRETQGFCQWKRGAEAPLEVRVAVVFIVSAVGFVIADA